MWQDLILETREIFSQNSIHLFFAFRPFCLKADFPAMSFAFVCWHITNRSEIKICSTTYSFYLKNNAWWKIIHCLIYAYYLGSLTLSVYQWPSPLFILIIFIQSCSVCNKLMILSSPMEMFERADKCTAFRKSLDRLRFCLDSNEKIFRDVQRYSEATCISKDLIFQIAKTIFEEASTWIKEFISYTCFYLPRDMSTMSLALLFTICKMSHNSKWTLKTKDIRHAA